MALGAWTVVAFLFRHDFAVYLVPSIVVLCVGVRTHWRQAAADVMVYTAMCMLLIAGPLYSIHRFVGLDQYLRTGTEISRSETARTRLLWPTFTFDGGARSFFDQEQNAAAAIYYLCRAVPCAH